jgi:hypothetical protein
MAVKLQSTKAKVRDPQKVQEILDSYGLQGVEIDLSKEAEGWSLEMTFEDEIQDWESVGEPAALHRRYWPTKEEVPDDDDADAMLDDLYEEQGAEGFLELRRALASYLETPLLIVRASGPCCGMPRPVYGVFCREPAASKCWT